MVSGNASLRAEMAQIATEAGAVEQRADALLTCLSRALPYTAAWIGLRDPETRVHHRVGSFGDGDALVRYFAHPEADEEVEALGLNRCQPPVPASSLGVPLAETRAWGEYLLPAGFVDGVVVGLFAEDGRHLGFLSLLSADPAERAGSYAAALADLRPIIVDAVDRLPSFSAAARLVGDAIGGLVITRAGRSVPVPGLRTHPLLAEGSATLAAARRHASAPGTAATFISPWSGSLLAISVLDCRDATDHLSALVLVRPADHAGGLEMPELRLLGALVEGWDDDRIGAAPGLIRTSGDALRLAERLGLPSVEALVQHAARKGCYVPSALWP
ncbi:hypothetical protein [Terrabacter sp. NPDC080008]|uniref:hypothetical protein n=1 Tax=Terrabacter sp. NPDC080008 TaxID=3155176 RepID=UPI00344E3D1C